MKKRLIPSFSAVVLSVLLCCCGKEAVEEDAVAAAVRQSYAALLEGRYADYADSLAGASLRNDDYNAQMAANAAMFMEQQQETHRGIVDIRVADVEIARGGNDANAFVVLCYADTTNEEIVVPMCKEQGVWRVR